MTTDRLRLLADTILLETLLAENGMHKQAGEITSILDGVKRYFASKYDPNHPNASVINELAPGAVWTLFQALGFGKWGVLIGLLMSVFHIDTAGLLNSIYQEVKSLISSGKPVSSSQVDRAVDSAVARHSGGNESGGSQTDQPQELAPPPRRSDQGQADDLPLERRAKLLRLALLRADAGLFRLDRNPIIISTAGLSAKGGASLLGKLFGWVIKIGLASAGLMVAGDVINKFVGRPNSLDGSYQAGQKEPSVVSEDSGQQSVPAAKQTVFPFKSDQKLPRAISIPNDQNSIEQTLIQFAKDTYDGLDGKEQDIISTPAFQALLQEITQYNEHHPGSALTFLPPGLSSKKQLTDLFIDQVAAKEPILPHKTSHSILRRLAT